jgi:hypothetical protein
MGLSRWLTVVRRIFLGLVLLVVLLSIGLRLRTYLLTRKVHEVLAGLERVEVDKTTETELLKAVPHLVFGWASKGGERTYLVKS